MSDPEILFERLRGLDLKEQSPAELRALVHEVHGFLDEKNHGHSIDLDQRVRLLRLWHVLILLGADVKDLMPSEVIPASEDELPPLADGELLAETPTIEPVPSRHSELSDVDSAAEMGSHSVIILPTPDMTKPVEVALETYGPFMPTAPLDKHKRIRMQLIKEGILMNHHLPPGTIVLVYPLDGQHLIEQGIAIRLPDRIDEPDLDAGEGVEF